MKKRVLALCMIALFVFCGTGEWMSARAAVKKTYVISNTMKVYKKPKTSSKSMGVLTYGEKISCVAVSGGWAKVKNSSGKVGYCKKSSLSSKNPNNLSKTVYINTANTRVYDRPSTSSRVLMKLKLNSKYKAVAKTRDGKWYRLKNGGSYGYVQVKYTSATRISTEKKTTKADKIVSLVKKQEGKGYAYGAEGSSRFDCSGLTCYVYKKAVGVGLKRSSADQASDSRFKKITSFDDLKKGDLLCFDTGSGSGCDHVGIYIGDGKFVHASQSKRRVVVSKLDTDYYRGSFLWARRIV